MDADDEQRCEGRMVKILILYMVMSFLSVSGVSFVSVE